MCDLCIPALPGCAHTAALPTEHAAKHAHPERASRVEGSLLAVCHPGPAYPNSLYKQNVQNSFHSPYPLQVPYPVSPLLATLAQTAGCGGILPILENLAKSATRTDFFIQVLSFHTLANSFAFAKSSTLLFSCKNTGRGGIVTRHFSLLALSDTIARLSVARRNPHALWAQDQNGSSEVRE